MTEQEFAAKIKQKYPQYANIDDATLTSKMLQKYPQYQAQLQGGTQTQQPNPYVDAVRDFGSGAVSQVPQVVANTASGAIDTADTLQGKNLANQFVDPRQGMLSQMYEIGRSKGLSDDQIQQEILKTGLFPKEQIQALGAQGKQATQQALTSTTGYNPDSFASKAGEFGTDLAATLLLNKGLGLGGKTKTGLEGAQKFITPVANSAASTMVANVPMQGKLPDTGQLAAGGVVDAGLGLLGGVAKGVRNAAWGNVLRQTPGDKKWLASKGIDAGEELTKNIGFTPTRESFMNKLGGAVNKAGQNIDESIDAARQSGFSFNPKTLTDAAENVDDYTANLTKSAPFTERLNIRDKALAEANALRSRILGGGNKIDDLVSLKREADAVVPYSKIDPVVNAQVAPYKAVADRARTLLPDNVQIANSKFAPLKALKDIADNRPTTSGYAGDIVGMAAGGNWKDKLINVAAQRVYRTPAVQTGVASIANKLGNAARSKVLNAGTKILLSGMGK